MNQTIDKEKAQNFAELAVEMAMGAYDHDPDADNYLLADFQDESGVTYQVSVQRQGGSTPSDEIAQLQGRIHALEARVVELSRVRSS